MVDLEKYQDRWNGTIKLINKYLLKKIIKKFFYNKKYNKEIFQKISKAYTKERYYHTLRHVFYMLDNIKDFDLNNKEQAKLELAIWFHDYIYNAQNTHNEVLSTFHFIGYAEAIGIRKKDIIEIRNLILDTKHEINPKTKLGKIICDLDLREFVSERQPLNTEEVRKEYSHISDEEFYKGRTEFLKSMLKKTHIYHTTLYREIFEKKAKQNLITELNNINKNGKT